MHQLALGDNICSYCLRFGEEFLTSAAARKSQTLTEAINKRVSAALKEAWTEDPTLNGQPLPDYWHVIEYPASSQGRPKTGGGIGSFHVHGQIVSTQETLPIIKAAFESAGTGYRQRGNNRTVHFGLPTAGYIRLTKRYKGCFTNTSASPERTMEGYTLNAASYAIKHINATETAAQQLGVNLGKQWGRSKKLRTEAEACLGIFKLLLDNNPCHVSAS